LPWPISILAHSAQRLIPEAASTSSAKFALPTRDDVSKKYNSHLMIYKEYLFNFN